MILILQAFDMLVFILLLVVTHVNILILCNLW